MALSSTERSRRCRKLQRSTSLAPSVVTSKVRKFLLSHPEQAKAVDVFMRKLSKSWELAHPSGKATIDHNEDADEVEKLFVLLRHLSLNV